MPKHLTESVAGSITATHTFTTGTCAISPAATFKADVIAEYTSATGVTVDGVLFKDGIIAIDTISEKSSGYGVTIDSVLLKDNAVTATSVTATTLLTDTVSEKTSTAGVTIDSVLLKDDGIAATYYYHPTTNTTVMKICTALSTDVVAGVTNMAIFGTLTTGTTITAGTTQYMYFYGDGQIAVTAGTTLTIASPSNIIAPARQQIFSGTGTVVFTKGGKVYPQWWGAKGDSSTNDNTAIQAALTAAEGGTIDFGDSECSYVVTTALTGPSNIHVESNGATVDITGLTTGTKHALVFSGSLTGTSTAISSGSSIFSYSVVVGSAAGITAGDHVLVTSSDDMPYTDASNDYYFGEILEVRSVASTTVTFTTPLNYTFSTSPYLQLVTWKEDIHVKGLRFIGADTPDEGQRGLCFRYVKRFSAKECVFDKIDTYGIEVNSSILGTVSENNLYGVYYPGITGTGSFYGIILLNCVQYVDVVNNTGSRCRHLVVTTANSTGQGYWGQPMFCNVLGNNFHDAESGAIGRSYAYENHGFGLHITWANNIANGCYSGINIRNGGGNLVTNNIIRNYAYAGVLIGSSGSQGATNLVISDNIIGGMTNEIAGAAGIQVETSAANYTNLVICNNTIRDSYNTGASESAIYISPNASYKGCVIDGNKIYSDSESGTYAIFLAGDSGTSTTDNWTVSGNTIYGHKNGIASWGDRTIIKGNTIRNAAAASSGYGIEVEGTDCVIQGNTAVYINTAFRAGASSVDTVIINNQAVGCTVNASFHASASGTTVSRDNDSM